MTNEIEDYSNQERRAILEEYKSKLTPVQYQELCEGGPYFTIEQRTLLEKVGLPKTEIDRLFPQLPTGKEQVQVGNSPESGGHIGN